MRKSQLALCLGAMMLVQLLILSGMVVKASLPLISGTEVRVKTVPIDPRSLFRGNYARLNYEFSRLPSDALSEHKRMRIGEVVFVKLEEGQDGLYRYHSAALQRPEDGVFIRGRITNTSPPYRVKYGIEAFFAPKEKALKLEKQLRESGVAVLKVSDSGRIALADVVPQVKN